MLLDLKEIPSEDLTLSNDRLRVGDALIVSLPEDAASGMMWCVEELPAGLVRLPSAPGKTTNLRLCFRAMAAVDGVLRISHSTGWDDEGRVDVCLEIRTADN